MTESLQKIKEVVQSEKVFDINKNNFKLEVLPITDQDRTEFVKCVSTGVPFSHRFKNEAFDVLIRDKTKKETDIVARQIDKAYNDGKILSPSEYANLFNLGCLYYQMEEYNGVLQIRQMPANVWDMKDFDLLTVIDSSTIGGLSSSSLFVLMGMMTQFNQKVYTLSTQLLSNPANFS